MPLVSVIVLGWGGEPYVARCLNALLRQTYARCEIIVVDNASPDRTAAIVETDFPQVRLIRTPRNLGVAGGNNAGFRAAQGDILILTNVDTEPHPDWVEMLVRAMQADPTIGVASSKLLYPDGLVQYAGGCINPVQGFAHHAEAGRQDEPDQAIRDVDFATGASLAIRRAVLQQIGLEDEAYFPIDYEDADLSYRARLAGWRVVYVPAAVSIHFESSTVKPLAPHRVLSSHVGRLRFVAKFWSTDQLTNTFLPKEMHWLSGLRSSTESVGQFLSTAMPLVYFKTLLDLNDLVAWRTQLAVGEAATSRATLTSMLTQLRADCLPLALTGVSDTAEARAAAEAVRFALHAWLPEEHQDAGNATLLALQSAQLRVNPHLPIAWPEWPPGTWPKVVAAVQKVTRRLLRWYIDPLVEQQNEINASLLQSLQLLSQEVLLLRQQASAQEGAPDAGRNRGTVPRTVFEDVEDSACQE